MKLGCESPWYGKQSDTPLLWEYKGHALAGFIGTVGDHINGLKVRIRPSLCVA